MGALESEFQSTHPRGVRPIGAGYMKSCMIFQSTHPRGVRPPEPIRSANFTPYFNPRTREGCDAVVHDPNWADHNFNPRTREGCDPYSADIAQGDRQISIHAPARGATAVLSKKINDFQISRSFFFCGAVQAAHWARKPTLKPHIRRTLAKRPVQQTADPALSRPKMRDLRPDFGANPSAIL